MVAVPVFYATSEGQTRRIAQRLAAALHARGLDSAPVDLQQGDEAGIDWSGVRGAVVGASIHIGKHQPAAIRFAEKHARELGARPSAFFSVSMAEASKNPGDVAAARALAQGFVDRAKWRPDFVVSLAGALVYTKYGWLTRIVMRRISRKEGGPTDTSRDYEFTDWAAVDRLAEQLAQRILAVMPVAAAV
ncbi:MAG TPA: flavodoxin domain-containing protein [Vicinamibacterales bacterium]|nr:flavodoxin domain-containing protein [Vicinamibacterales bacterium]